MLKNGFDSKMHTLIDAKGKCFLRHSRGARHVTFFSFDDKTLNVDTIFATILTKIHQAIVVCMRVVSIHVSKPQRACISDNFFLIAVHG